MVPFARAESVWLLGVMMRWPCYVMIVVVAGCQLRCVAYRLGFSSSPLGLVLTSCCSSYYHPDFRCILLISLWAWYQRYTYFRVMLVPRSDCMIQCAARVGGGDTCLTVHSFGELTHFVYPFYGLNPDTQLLISVGTLLWRCQTARAHLSAFALPSGGTR